MPLTFHSPKKKAKEIALDAAVRTFVFEQMNKGTRTKQLTEHAELIYQWLIKTD